MKKKELVNRKELCATLDFSFDEANELFSSETLSNMTMAQISGGSSTKSYVSFQVFDIKSGSVLYTITVDGVTSTKSHSSITNNGDGTLSFEMGYYDSSCSCGGGYRSEKFTVNESELVVGKTFYGTSFDQPHCNTSSM